MKSEVVTKATILAVDEEEDILELIRINLSREGYYVVCAESGEIALQIVKTNLVRRPGKLSRDV